MPKKINDPKQLILTVARKQVLEQGYSCMTIRSVAQECGIAVGTIYNYYTSKEELTAAFMLSGWRQQLQEMQDTCAQTNEPSVVLRCVYEGLHSFAAPYQQSLFQDDMAEKTYGLVSGQWHVTLREQLSALLTPLCREKAAADSDFLPAFVAEALLTWTLAGQSFEELQTVLLRLFCAE